jgi:hypothetical protein
VIINSGVLAHVDGRVCACGEKGGAGKARDIRFVLFVIIKYLDHHKIILFFGHQYV